MQRRAARILFVLLGSAAAVVASAQSGWAADDGPPGLVVTTDSDGLVAVDVSRSDDGGFSGTLTLSNTTESSYPLTIEGVGDLDTCPLTVSPSTLPPYRTTTVKIATKQGCEISDGGEAVVLAFGDSADTLEVAVTEDATEAVGLSTLLPWFGWAAGASVAALLILYLSVIRPRTYHKSQGGKLAYQAKTKDGIEVWEPVTAELTLGTEVTGAPSGWTFKDSWASNLSVGTTVFIALFGSEDILSALFGDAPEETLSRLLIVGAVAGLLVGLAPLVIKTMGSTTEPTVGGLLAGALFTLTGVLGQILAISWILRKDELTDAEAEDWLPVQLGALVKDRDEVAIIGVALSLFLLFYAFWTLRVLIIQAFPSPGDDRTSPDPVPNDLLLVAALLADDSSGERPGEAIAAALARAARGARLFTKGSLSDDEDYPVVDSLIPTSRGDEPPPLPGMVL